MTPRLSNSPPWLPRASDASMIRRRRSRSSSAASGGWPLVLRRAITYLPSRSCAAAASAAAAISFSERPASAARDSTTTAPAFTSFSTFWVNVVSRPASSALISRSRSWSASGSRAPARTKSL